MVKNKINISEIRKLIPHREPFLYIDELINIEKLDKATGIKNLHLRIVFLRAIFQDIR